MLERFTEFIKSTVTSLEFMLKSKRNPKDFTRNRKLSFSMNILLVLSILNHSIQTGIDQFLIEVETGFDTYSKQAFSQGRQRILPEAFLDLHKKSVEFFYNEADYETYFGHRILAVDGSKINLPYNKELLDIYGSQKSTNDLVQSLASCVVDVLNNTILDGIMAPYDSNEHKLAEQHINNLKGVISDKDIILFDRGYPSSELMQFLNNVGCKYIMRCNSTFLAKALKNLHGNDCIITHKFVKTGITLTFRVIRFPISDSTTEILITNILDKFSVAEFKHLYNLRWGIEKTYNCIKNKFDLESFSGTKPVCVLQDFYANLLLYNALAILMYENNKKLAENRDPETKYVYKTNENQAVNKIRENLIKAVMAENSLKRAYLFRKIFKQLQKEVVPVRPNRICDNNRKAKHPFVKFSQNQKY